MKTTTIKKFWYIIALTLLLTFKYRSFAAEQTYDAYVVEEGNFEYGSNKTFDILSEADRGLEQGERQNKHINQNSSLKVNKLMTANPSNADGIKYKGEYQDVQWSIDVYGTLHVKGTGEFKPRNQSDERFYYAPWHGYEDEILIAVVETKQTTDLSQMFYQCNNLHTVRFTNTEMLYIENMQGTFSDCPNLKNIYWGLIDTSKVKNMNALFCNCISLEEIDLSRLSLSQVETMSYMFYGCENLTKIKWGSKKPQNLKYMGVMFTFCWNLLEIDLSGFNCNTVDSYNTSYMLYKCNKLIKIISPSSLSNSSIDLYTDTSLDNLFMWTKVGSQQEEIAIEPSTSIRTYVKVCTCDYWNMFLNEASSFKTISEYYYVTDSDYERLLSKLSPNEVINITGSEKKYLYHPSQFEGTKNRLWVGSCQGMATWSALQNNKWKTLQGGLKGVSLNYDIESKINYYHVQQHLRSYCISDDAFRSMSKEARIANLYSALTSGNTSLITYIWNSESDGSTTVSQAHAVCGLTVRYVDSNEKTNKGRDVSSYMYCAIVYDPDVEEISRNSDANIYFNADGSFYIPYRELKNDYGDFTRLRNVVADRESLNLVDYDTGIPSSKVTSTSNNDKVFMRLTYGKPYTIKWENGQVSISDTGSVEGAIDSVYITSEVSGDVPDLLTITLPTTDVCTISSTEEFDVFLLGNYYTSYVNVSSGGEVTFRNDGYTYIEAEPSVNKEIYIGMNDGFIENPWNYMYVTSKKGTTLSANNLDKSFVVESDNLTEAVVKLANEYNEEVDPIILPHNTTRAAFSKGDDGIIIEHNGDVIDDGNDDHQIADGFRASFEITDSWEGGYNALIRIENTSEENIDNWTLAFDYDGEISNVWNAEILSHDGNRYTIKNAGWNQDIAPGQTIEIGLSGQENFVAEPTDYALISGLNEGNTNDFSVSVQIYDDWGSGCNGNMIITNNSDTTIEDWVLEFDFDAGLTSIWNAEIVSHEGAHYIIKNVQHNSNIEPGQSARVGFNGGEGAGSTELRGYKLYSYGL